MLRILLACAILAAIAPRARADTLLGSYSTFHGGGNEAPLSRVVSISFEIGYDASPEGPACNRIRVGCEPIPLAQVHTGAVFTFDATHGRHFSEVAAFLTNGGEEPVWESDRLWDARGAIVSGSAGGGLSETNTFHLVPGIQTYTITRIELTLDSFEIGDQSICDAPPIGHCYKATRTWRIYGTPVATPVLARSWGTLKSLYR